ncbi:MAG: threonine--tRNA ligase [Fusobacteriota bacterium]
MIIITLPDGSELGFEKAVSVMEIAETIGAGLARVALAGKVDGKPVDMSYVVENDAKLEIITPRTDEGVEIIRHSAAHVMAQAVTRLFPDAKVAIGPAIEDGFYYDFDLEHNFTDSDLEKIEKEMKKIVKEDLEFKKKVMPKEEAIKYFEDKGEKYKVELIKSFDDEVVNLYNQGDFVDLCRGPHVPSTKYLKAFKLKSVAGAYWRGDADNKMLQRIYGYAFAKKKELKKHINLLKEAEKRDHRKIGKELDLFTMSDFGPGFPFFLPKGMVIKNKLMEIWRDEHKKAGYEEIQTPIILNRSLWETSGHWFNYKENMYTSVIDDEDVAIKPMNCPGCILVYKNGSHSYRDFPMRIGEMGLVHRHELSGSLHGLMRVRAFTQDDAHIFMTPDQIEDEVIKVIDLYEKFYDLFDLDFHIELSTKPEKAIGEDAIWETAEKALEGAMKKSGRDYKMNPGDGAFYGPKLDFKLKDAIGRIWQCGTIQLDFNLPERFDLNYIGEDGEKHRPVMIHRAMYGSLERFMGILIEHYEGEFPLWLAPVQVKFLTISDDQNEYAKDIMKQLEEKGIRAQLDDRAEKIGFKIREANLNKIPVQVIIGSQEEEKGEVNIRRFGSKKSENFGKMKFIENIIEEAKVKFKK